MPEAHTLLPERIARVLAGYALSSNARGDEASASGKVDDAWHEYRGQALAVIHELREPDPVMAAAGDTETWSAMVRAALDSAGADHA